MAVVSWPPTKGAGTGEDSGWASHETTFYPQSTSSIKKGLHLSSHITEASRSSKQKAIGFRPIRTTIRDLDISRFFCSTHCRKCIFRKCFRYKPQFTPDPFFFNRRLQFAGKGKYVPIHGVKDDMDLGPPSWFLVQSTPHLRTDTPCFLITYR